MIEVSTVTSTRTYDFDGGNKLHASRRDPYGFIYVHAEHGAVPQELAGMFTSYDEADKAIQAYIVRKEKTVTNKPSILDKRV